MFRTFDQAAHEILAALRKALGDDLGAQVQRMTLEQVRAAVPDCAAAQDALDASGGRYARCMLHYLRALLAPPKAPLTPWHASATDAPAHRPTKVAARNRAADAEDRFLF